MAAFELCFSIGKEFFQKKVSREITYDLISLFHVQIQEPTNMSTTRRAFTLQNLLKFIITKYLKQEVDDDLSVYIDECSPCGLSITGDIKSHDHMIKR